LAQSWAKAVPWLGLEIDNENVETSIIDERKVDNSTPSIIDYQSIVPIQAVARMLLLF